MVFNLDLLFTLIVALQAGTNNCATTVLQIFLHAIEKYGVPLRVRGD
jgi:hypothetical protein